MAETPSPIHNPNTISEGALVPGTPRALPACPLVADNGNGGEELREALECLNQILLLEDIPLEKRIHVVLKLAEIHPAVHKVSSGSVKGLDYQVKGPGYEVVYSFKPLISYLYQ